jgi:hypothetical protein
MDGICGRQVVSALRNCADLVIDLPLCHSETPVDRQFCRRDECLRVFATSVACGRAIGRNAELGFDSRELCRRDNRVPPPPDAAGVSG